MLPAPTYFEKCTKPVSRSTEDYEWAGNLISSSGGRKFSIKYYGELADEYIVGSLDSIEIPSLVVAVAVDSGEEFVLFDESRHGYNAMFCDEYKDEIRNARKTDSIYVDEDGESIFEIELMAYYNIDYDDEKEDFVDANNNVDLIFGEQISFEDLKRNGYDYFEIRLTNSKGKQTTPIAPELA